MGQNEITRGWQVLVVVPFTRVPFWVPIFDPHPSHPEVSIATFPFGPRREEPTDAKRALGVGLGSIHAVCFARLRTKKAASGLPFNWWTCLCSHEPKPPTKGKLRKRKQTANTISKTGATPTIGPKMNQSPVDKERECSISQGIHSQLGFVILLTHVTGSVPSTCTLMYQHV